MKLTASVILLICALVCFLLAGLMVNTNGKVSFSDLGFAFVIAAYLAS